MLFFFKIWRHQREEMLCVLIVNGCCGDAVLSSGVTSTFAMFVCVFSIVEIERMIPDKL